MGVEGSVPGALCSIHLPGLDGRHLKPGSAPTLPAACSQALGGLAIRPEVDSFGAALPEREAVVVGDIETDPIWAEDRDLGLEHGLRASRHLKMWCGSIALSNWLALTLTTVHFFDASVRFFA